MNRSEWPREALKRAADRVRQSTAGSRHDTLRAQAIAIAPYVSHGHLTADSVQEALLDAAGAVGMDGKRRGEAVRTILSGLDKGAGGEAWLPDETTGPQRTTARWRGRVYTVTGGRVTAARGFGGRVPSAPWRGVATIATIFPRLMELQGIQEELTWDDIAEACREPAAWPESGKDGLPLWSWCLFEEASRARRPDGLHPDGRERTRDARMYGVGALVLDYDDDPEWSLESTRRWWGDVRYVAHTTSTHMLPKKTSGGHEKPPMPRGRVIVALSRVVTEEEWPDLVDWVLSSGRGSPGETELRSARRAYYVPAQLDGYAWEANEVDAALDVDACLQEAREAREVIETAADEVEPDQDILASLPKSRNGDIRDTIATLQAIFDEDRRWQGRLRWSELTGQPEMDGQTITDEMETEAAAWVENVYGVKCSTARIHEVLRSIAARHPYHPVVEYLEGVTWDGVERLDFMLEDYFGATSTLSRAYSRCWLISMVARVMQPGCKVDTVPILKGLQGGQKSTMLSILGGKWFSDSTISIGEKEGYQQLRGIWLLELGELDAVAKREWSSVKAFTSAQVDTYRPSYGRNTIRVPRQTVFVGTTNEASFLGDATGSRRFWVISVADQLDVEGLAKVRDQLFAEAVVRYRAGERWWLTPEEDAIRAEEAKAYESVDPWMEAVSSALIGLRSTTLAEIAWKALEKKPGELHGGDEKRLSRILDALGWARANRPTDPDNRRRKLPWRWEPKG